MCRNKPVFSLLLAAGFTLGLTGACRAADGSATVTNAQIRLEKEPLQTIEPVYRAYVTVGSQRFAFLLPQGFRVQPASAPGKLVVANPEGNCELSFSVVNFTGSDLSGTKSEAYRDMILLRHFEGKIQSEFPCAAAGRSGLGFDLRRKTLLGFEQSTRVVYIPSTAGLLEFSLSAESKNFPGLLGMLDRVLRSFQASVNGKLEVQHLADQS